MIDIIISAKGLQKISDKTIQKGMQVQKKILLPVTGTAGTRQATGTR